MEAILEKAIQLATQYHDGQVDKGGHPYINHPLRVMNSVTSTECKVVAVLHDVLEDCDVTAEDLLEAGIPNELVACVTILTKPRWEPYMDYIEQVAKDPRTRQVKLADLKDNMDLTRLYPSIDVNRLHEESYLEETLTERDLKRYQMSMRKPRGRAPWMNRPLMRNSFSFYV